MKEKKLGRPRIKIDWNRVDNLCYIHCTGPEIASVLGVDEDTLTAACKRDKNKLFSEYIKEKSMGGKASLRRRLFKMAEDGNLGAAIWLSKQYLGMKDKQEVEHSGNLEVPTITVQFTSNGQN